MQRDPGDGADVHHDGARRIVRAAGQLAAAWVEKRGVGERLQQNCNRPCRPKGAGASLVNEQPLERRAQQRQRRPLLRTPTPRTLLDYRLSYTDAPSLHLCRSSSLRKHESARFVSSRAARPSPPPHCLVLRSREAPAAPKIRAAPPTQPMGALKCLGLWSHPVGVSWLARLHTCSPRLGIANHTLWT